MRFASLEKFKTFFPDYSLDDVLLINILDANNIEYLFISIDKSILDDDYLYSLLEMQGWQNNKYFAIYEPKNFNPKLGTNLSFYKSLQPGLSSSLVMSYVFLINNLDHQQVIDICKRTLKMKAFL